MKVGVTLPQFRPDGEEALAAARLAEESGLDGVFVFDHLWPLGRPDRPALSAFPLLGALAAETARVALGTLVARVGLVPDAVLVHELETLHRMVGGRLIAGLGTGDRLSAQENLAFGLPFPPGGERLAAVAACCRALRAAGVTTWVGGRSAAVREVAGREADALNLWGVDPAEVAASAGAVTVTWGGPVGDDPAAAADLLGQLAAAGATWAVCAPAYPPGQDPRRALETLGGLRQALG